jgi:signal transduction histidine kinase
MTRRVLLATLVVATLALVLFGAPLALAVRREYRTEAVLRLARATVEAGRTIDAGAFDGSDIPEFPIQAATRFALYRADGSRVVGQGPIAGDAAVRTAAASRVTDVTTGGVTIVAVPVFAAESVIGVLRSEQPASVVDRRVHRTWLTMLGFAVAALAIAGGLGALLARRINRPVERLRLAARALGQGDYLIDVPKSGIGELDQVGASLSSTARQLGTQLERERAFSADASHQLRTPLAGLRLILEAELDAPLPDRREAVQDALQQVNRLEATIDDILSLARDAAPDRQALDLTVVLRDAERRWHGQLAARGRPLRLDLPATLPRPHASRSAVDHIIDVLVDNALVHGTGRTTLAARSLQRGVAISVADEATSAIADRTGIFERRHGGRGAGAKGAGAKGAGDGYGIGLALARSLAAAEGGRLHLVGEPPDMRFELTLPLAGPTG